MIKAHATTSYRGIFQSMCLLVTTVFIAFVFRMIPIPKSPTALLVVFLVFQFVALPGLLLTSTVFFGRGCWMYAKAKGYPPVIGLVGLIPFIGLITLCVLPDLAKGAKIAGFDVIFPKAGNRSIFATEARTHGGASDFGRVDAIE